MSFITYVDAELVFTILHLDLCTFFLYDVLVKPSDESIFKPDFRSEIAY